MWHDRSVPKSHASCTPEIATYTKYSKRRPASWGPGAQEDWHPGLLRPTKATAVIQCHAVPHLRLDWFCRGQLRFSEPQWCDTTAAHGSSCELPSNGPMRLADRQKRQAQARGSAGRARRAVGNPSSLVFLAICGPVGTDGRKLSGRAGPWPIIRPSPPDSAVLWWFVASQASVGSWTWVKRPGHNGMSTTILPPLLPAPKDQSMYGPR